MNEYYTFNKRFIDNNISLFKKTSIIEKNDVISNIKEIDYAIDEIDLYNILYSKFIELGNKDDAFNDLIDNIDREYKKTIIKLDNLYNLELYLAPKKYDVDFIVVILFTLSVVSYILFLISMFFAEKIFTNNYFITVYGETNKAPSMYTYWIIIMVIYIVFIVFLGMLLLLIIKLFPTKNIITYFILSLYSKDQIIIIILLSIVSVITLSVITNNKNFDYENEGLRCMRSFNSVIKFFSLFMYVFTYSFIEIIKQIVRISMDTLL